MAGRGSRSFFRALFGRLRCIGPFERGERVLAPSDSVRVVPEGYIGIRMASKFGSQTDLDPLGAQG